MLSIKSGSSYLPKLGRHLFQSTNILTICYKTVHPKTVFFRMLRSLANISASSDENVTLSDEDDVTLIHTRQNNAIGDVMTSSFLLKQFY